MLFFFLMKASLIMPKNLDLGNQKTLAHGGMVGPFDYITSPTLNWNWTLGFGIVSRGLVFGLQLYSLQQTHYSVSKLIN